MSEGAAETADTLRQNEKIVLAIRGAITERTTYPLDTLRGNMVFGVKNTQWSEVLEWSFRIRA